MLSYQALITHGMIKRTSQGLPVPHYTVDGVAKVFFGRSAHWLRSQMSETGEHREGASQATYLIGDRQVTIGLNRSGYRIFSLFDVENVAHAIYQHERRAADLTYNERLAAARLACDAGEMLARDVRRKERSYARILGAIDQRALVIRDVIRAQAILWGMLPLPVPAAASDDKADPAA
jgi:hypothetical protein